MRQEHIDLISYLMTKDLPSQRTCETCGKVLPVGDSALNVLHVGQIGSPGHPGIEAFQCLEEHWTCSPVCWEAASIKCIQEDMRPILEKVHARLRGE